MQSEMRCTIPSLQLSQPNDHQRTYRVFRDLKKAFAFVQRQKEWRHAKMTKVQFGNDPRDLRYVVNMFGSNPRQSVKLSAARVWKILEDGTRLEIIAASENKTQQQIS